MGAFNATKYYRSKLLSDLSACMNKSQEENRVKDAIIMGNANEYAEENNITHFMNEDGLINVHKCIN